MKILLGTVVESIKSRVDGSLTITMATQEIEPQQVGEVFSMRNKFVKTLISDNHISAMQEQLIDEEIMLDGRKVKSRSAKLRSVLFVYFTKSGNAEEDFDAYYADVIDGLIAEYKSKIPKDY